VDYRYLFKHIIWTVNVYTYIFTRYLQLDIENKKLNYIQHNEYIYIGMYVG